MKILASVLSFPNPHRRHPSSVIVEVILPFHHPSQASNSQSIFPQANLKPPECRHIRFNHTRCAGSSPRLQFLHFTRHSDVIKPRPKAGLLFKLKEY